MAGIPFTPVDPGHTVAGKVSWFGGPSEPGTTASGVSDAVPGIAVYNRATLGGYWQVTDQKTGKTAVLKQTDLGPAPWTGRSIDVTVSAIPQFGYSQGNFPTDTSFTAKYLGRNPSRAASHQGASTSAADSALGQAQPQAQGQPTQQQANAPILLKALLGGGGGKSAYDAGLPKVKGLPAGTGGLGPLAAAGLLQAPTAPAQGAQAGQAGSVAQAKPGGLSPGGLSPVAPAGTRFAGKGLQFAGFDQGADYTGGGNVYAPADIKIVSVNRASGWPGEHALLVGQVLNGPAAGRYIYVAEDFVPAQTSGVVKAGGLLGRATGSGRAPGIEAGFAQNASGAAYGSIRDGKPGGPNPQYGQQFGRYIGQR